MTPTLSVPTAVLFLPCNKLTPPVLSFFSFLAGIIHFPEHLRQSLFTCLVVILRRFCSVLLFPWSVPTALPNQTIASKFLFCFCLLSPPSFQPFCHSVFPFMVGCQYFYHQTTQDVFPQAFLLTGSAPSYETFPQVYLAGKVAHVFQVPGQNLP